MSNYQQSMPLSIALLQACSYDSSSHAALELCPLSATCEQCVVHTNNIVVSLKMPFFLSLAFSLNLNNISPTCKN